MTSSAFPFLDGRSALDGPVVRMPRRRAQHPGRAVGTVRLRFRRVRPATSRTEQDPRETTDAYLDRVGLSSVDWADTVARHAQR